MAAHTKGKKSATGTTAAGAFVAGCPPTSTKAARAAASSRTRKSSRHLGSTLATDDSLDRLVKRNSAVTSSNPAIERSCTSPVKNKRKKTTGGKKKKTIMGASSSPKSKKKNAGGTILVCRIESHRSNDSFLSIPLHLIETREAEMQAAALTFGVDPSRWNGSLLWRESGHGNGSLDLTLRPEHDCATRHFSHTFAWKPWLTYLLQSYYQTGKLQVPSECQGADLLLALEYFGILYQPDQLVFDTYASYQRVKVWSDYFTHRAALADWLANTILEHPLHHYMFATTRHLPKDKVGGSWMELGGRRLALFHGGLSKEVVQSLGARNSADFCFDLFNTTSTAAALREDFCLYVQSILSDVHVTFPVKKVTVHEAATSKRQAQASKQEQRAVLMMDIIISSSTTSYKSAVDVMPSAIGTPTRKGFRTKSDLSCPMDEYVQDDMQTGKLERLMKQVDSKHQYEPVDDCEDDEDSPKQTIDDIYRDLEENALTREANYKQHRSSNKDVIPPTAKAAFAGIKPRPGDKQYHPDQVYEDAGALAKLLEPVLGDKNGDSVDTSQCAPVNLVNLRKNSSATQNSGTSALTGPFFIDDKGNLRDVHGGEEEIKAQRLRQEWIQGSLLNRGISDRIKKLLHKDKNKANSTADTSVVTVDEQSIAVTRPALRFADTVETYENNESVAPSVDDFYDQDFDDMDEDDEPKLDPESSAAFPWSVAETLCKPFNSCLLELGCSDLDKEAAVAGATEGALRAFECTKMGEWLAGPDCDCGPQECRPTLFDPDGHCHNNKGEEPYNIDEDSTCASTHPENETNEPVIRPRDSRRKKKKKKTTSTAAKKATAVPASYTGDDLSPTAATMPDISAVSLEKEKEAVKETTFPSSIFEALKTVTPTAAATKPVVPKNKAIVPKDKATVAKDKVVVSTDKAVVRKDKIVVAKVKAAAPKEKAVVAMDKVVAPSDKAAAPEDRNNVAKNVVVEEVKSIKMQASDAQSLAEAIEVPVQDKGLPAASPEITIASKCESTVRPIWQREQLKERPPPALEGTILGAGGAPTGSFDNNSIAERTHNSKRSDPPETGSYRSSRHPHRSPKSTNKDDVNASILTDNKRPSVPKQITANRDSFRQAGKKVPSSKLPAPARMSPSKRSTSAGEKDANALAVIEPSSRMQSSNKAAPPLKRSGVFGFFRRTKA